MFIIGTNDINKMYCSSFFSGDKVEAIIQDLDDDMANWGDVKMKELDKAIDVSSDQSLVELVQEHSLFDDLAILNGADQNESAVSLAELNDLMVGMDSSDNAMSKSPINRPIEVQKLFDRSLESSELRNTVEEGDYYDLPLHSDNSINSLFDSTTSDKSSLNGKPSKVKSLAEYISNDSLKKIILMIATILLLVIFALFSRTT